MAEVPPVITPPMTNSRRALISAIITGFIVGLFSWLLSMAIANWLIDPLFCRSTDTFAVCSNGGTVSWVIATLVLSILGLLALVRQQVFRPLLIVLASLVALWTASSWLGPLEWWQAMLWHAALFALAYALFTWIARINSFLIALIITVVTVVLARFVVINS